MPCVAARACLGLCQLPVSGVHTRGRVFRCESWLKLSFCSRGQQQACLVQGRLVLSLLNTLGLRSILGQSCLWLRYTVCEQRFILFVLNLLLLIHLGYRFCITRNRE